MATTIENASSKVEEFQFHSVPHTTKWESLKKAIYDPEEEKVFGRTVKSWYKLLIFYTIFYACLAAFFAICMKGLIGTLDDKEPKWQLSESLIGTNPGLGFRPISYNTARGPLIRYNLKEKGTSEKCVNLIAEFLTPYNKQQVGNNYQNCYYNNTAKEGHVCTVELSNFGPCTQNNNYGYNSHSPCVFLKLNRIFGWVPEFYNETTEEMPPDLKTLVESGAKDNKNQVWISCNGKKAVDQEQIGGFNYFPSQGFPGYYFPYKNQENYLSPLIAVQVLNVSSHTIVNIECRAWARNIVYNGSNKDRKGSVEFEILVEV